MPDGVAYGEAGAEGGGAIVEEVDSPHYGRFSILRADAEMSRAVRRGLLWERRLVAAFSPFADPGSVVIDVGANLGCHTVVLAGRVAPGGRVVAYEPQPLLADLLTANAARAEADVIVRRVAVGGGPARLQVALPDYATSSNPGGWSLLIGSQGAGTARVHLAPGTVEVPVVSLDDDAASWEGAGPVALVKIDVEGMELDVLRGAERLLREHAPAVFVETRAHRPAVERLLAEAGYGPLAAVGTPAGADFAAVPGPGHGALLASLEALDA